MPRPLKRLVILLVYILVIGGVVGWSYSSHYGPTCQDGLQNGREEGIDCGTIACGMACASPIQPVVIQQIELVKTPTSDYDVAMKFYNPNTDYGIAGGTYNLDIGPITTPHGEYFYMLPGQTKYVVLTSLKNIPDGSTASASIESVQWQKVSGQVPVQFSSTNGQYVVAENQTTFETTITNSSDFDFGSVEVGVMVRDLTGKLIATNVTKLQTVLSRTNRYIKLSWPFALSPDARVQVDISTNVFDNDNFLKTHGTQEKFQQFF